MEERLAALNRLRAEPVSEQTIETLRQALASKNNHIVARAAQVAGELEIDQLEPNLAEAFERFMVNPVKTDKGCKAKSALAEVLQRMGCHREDLFLRGIHYAQSEPVWGGKEDTAATLRGLCAMGLVQMNHRHAMVELADLLADPEPDARIAAARAIAYARQPAGVPLLRFKALSGDAHPQVLVECFAALLNLSPESSLPFVARFLHARDAAVAEAAAMALGESRLGEAFEPLKAAWEDTLEPAFRRAALLAVAMLRHEEAIEFLLSLITAGSSANAREAVEAMRMYERDDRLWQRVQQALRQRDGATET